MRTTRKAISAEIKKRTGMDILVGGSQAIGCYHFYSDDSDTASMLAKFYSTTVDVFSLSDLTVERWADEFDAMLEKTLEWN